jgi:trimethyllysine dioxygenase
MKDSQDKISNFYTQIGVAKLIQASVSDNGLVVDFVIHGSDDQARRVYPWMWVRDHCIDPVSLDQQTTQRTVDTFNLGADLKCDSLELLEREQLIHFLWNDQTRSSISAYVLASVVGLENERHQLVPSISQVLWSKKSPLKKIPRVAFDDIIQSEAGLLSWLENIHIYGFSLVEGVPKTPEGTTQLALRLGMVQETIFGGLWPLSSEISDHGDSAYSDSYLEPHTDGTYYHDAAGLQMFNCLEIDCKGGESIQVDGFAIAERIKREDPDAYQTLCEVVVPGHYIDSGIHLRAERPAFSLDASGRLVQVSFNNYDRAPMLLDHHAQQRFYHAYGLLHSHVIDQDNWLKIKMTPGTTLIFDNWRNLHGRMGYSGKRTFYGCYHSKAVYESRLRVLQNAI